MRIVVANNMSPFIHGGAEELANTLVTHLEARGHDVDLVRIPFRWEPYTVLPKQIAISHEMSLGLADRVIALKFPAYLIPHDEKTLWLLHQYRQAYDLYDAGYSNLPADREGEHVREAIVRADNAAFEGSRKIFTNSPTTSARLSHYNGFSSEVLYPPLNDPELFRTEARESYIFAGGRVNAMKRQELLIRALAHTPERVKLVIAGPPDSEATARSLEKLADELGVSHRLTLDLRMLSRVEVARWVNRAAACAYIPFDEDSLGYVSMEAAQARKPVITASDSGGILGLVQHGGTGWIAEPDEQSLAEMMTAAIAKPAVTRARGTDMYAHWLSFGATWSKTIDRLLG